MKRIKDFLGNLYVVVSSITWGNMKRIKDYLGNLYVVVGLILGCLALWTMPSDFSALFQIVGFPMSIILIVLGVYKLNPKDKPIITKRVIFIIIGMLFLWIVVFGKACTESCNEDWGGPPNQPNPPNVNGVWDFTISVTQTNGACGIEGGTSTKPMTITQSDQNITIAGFADNLANKLSGTISYDWSSGWVINVTGSYPEDNGTTSSSYRFALYNTNPMLGSGDWSWTGSEGSCGGKMTVIATRVP